VAENLGDRFSAAASCRLTLLNPITTQAQHEPHRSSLSRLAAARLNHRIVQIVWRDKSGHVQDVPDDPPASRLVRVVVIRDDADQIRTAFFSTDPDLIVGTILEYVADHCAIEQNFHDVKEVEGADPQQLRNVFSSLAAWHLYVVGVYAGGAVVRTSNRRSSETVRQSTKG